MRFWNFDWDEDNIDHIARHGVDVDEVEEALSRKPLIRKGRARNDIGLLARRRQDGIFLLWSRIWVKAGRASLLLGT